MERRLVRIVPALGFLARSRPTFLYRSGRAGRCNPAGVECLYFSETEAVANLEYLGGLADTTAVDAPKLTFVAEVDLRFIVDLEKIPVRRLLGLKKADLSLPWRFAKGAAPLQRLGDAIARQRRVSAMRFPSEAARRAGRAGWNVAIFPTALAAPSHLRILGEGGRALEELP